MGLSNISELDEIVHEQNLDSGRQTNAYEFMQQYDIQTTDELITRTTTSVDGIEASGLDWFWDEVVEYLDIEFYEDYDTVRDNTSGPQFTHWYPGGKFNIAHNVLDRHAATNPENTACLWESEPGDVTETSFQELNREANQVANALSESGIEEGDRVGLYMPMAPEAISILYGCFKIGAVVVPIFSGFGVEATASRLQDAGCRILFTADGFYRRGSEVDMKTTADAARKQADSVERTIVFDRLDADPDWDDAVDDWWANAVLSQSTEFETRELDADAEAMVLYSSGTTGKPKGIVQTHAGLLVNCATELYFHFDLKPDDRFFWLTDIGWMMGPWALLGNHTFGSTVFLYEGAPDYPEADRLWEMVDRHELTIFGISPTAVRALMKSGDEWVHSHDLSSLRLLGSAGEPWDPESWCWFYEQIGNGEIPIMNIIGGTEICGCFLMPFPSNPQKPCTVGGPAVGKPVDIVNEAGESIADTNERGYLVATDSCPSMTNSLWSGDSRYLEEYWSTFDDLWDHGDWAQKDEDGFWFLHGRADDALNVAGRKVGPAEIEGVAIEHDCVNQAAAVGVPDETTGTAVVLYVIVEAECDESELFREEIRDRIGQEHGKPFKPREILFVDEFPKTQSGKIVRGIISLLYQGEEIEETSSIENPESLVKVRDAR
ncbi:AMP-binding protein [Haladaptatus sp. YSMS36]|uniref:AMP-binding protein n=1 Tax=Haladaptatus sp. YSMS36 TaxID=3033384 RepID=UPI0023E7BC27|nr:AMP-binding protein [Haladaptatus sp. YSMS36]